MKIPSNLISIQTAQEFSISLSSKIITCIKKIIYRLGKIWNNEKTPFLQKIDCLAYACMTIGALLHRPILFVLGLFVSYMIHGILTDPTSHQLHKITDLMKNEIDRLGSLIHTLQEQLVTLKEENKKFSEQNNRYDGLNTRLESSLDQIQHLLSLYHRPCV